MRLRVAWYIFTLTQEITHHRKKKKKTLVHTDYLYSFCFSVDKCDNKVGLKHKIKNPPYTREKIDKAITLLFYLSPNDVKAGLKQRKKQEEKPPHTPKQIDLEKKLTSEQPGDNSREKTRGGRGKKRQRNERARGRQHLRQKKI